MPGGAAPSEGSTGAGASASRMLGPGCWRRTSASCWHWWEALFPDHGDLPRGHFNVQPPRQPASPQGSEQRRRVVGEGNALHSPLSEVTLPLPPHAGLAQLCTGRKGS